MVLCFQHLKVLYFGLLQYIIGLLFYYIYLCELFSDHFAGSGRTSQLSIPKSHLNCTRAFEMAGPKLWNSLPGSIRDSHSIDIFKRQLKTHLFTHSYYG